MKNISCRFLNTVFFSTMFISAISAQITIMPPLLVARPNLTQHLGYLPTAAIPTPLDKITTTNNNLLFKNEFSQPPTNQADMRRLEFIFGEALCAQAKGILTIAPYNNAFAHTALRLARNLNLEAYFFYHGPSMSTAQEALAELEKNGVQTRSCRTRGIMEQTMHALNRQFKKQNSSALYFIPEDGQNEVGTLGFVNAAYELKDQLEIEQISNIGAIYFISNSVVDIAGLLLGLEMISLPCPVIVLTTNPEPTAMLEKVQLFFDHTADYLAQRDLTFVQPLFPTSKYSIISCANASTEEIINTIKKHELCQTATHISPLAKPICPSLILSDTPHPLIHFASQNTQDERGVVSKDEATYQLCENSNVLAWNTLPIDFTGASW